LIGSDRTYIKNDNLKISEWKEKFKLGGYEVGRVLKIWYKDGSKIEGKFVGFVPGNIRGTESYPFPGIVILTKINGDYPTDDVWNLYVVFEDIDYTLLEWKNT